MNHDCSHCLDFNDSCPKKCFRAELVRDLRSRKDMVGVPISWTHYKGTDECPKVERIETIESHIRNGKGEWAWECTTGELIRCKDCKYNNGGRCSWHGGAGYKWIVDDDDFCSIAERKEE